ncbi:MAG: hypothetical protein AAFU78_01420 [Cyanobacteria bacterium J06633_2]
MTRSRYKPVAQKYSYYPDSDETTCESLESSLEIEGNRERYISPFSQGIHA